MLVHKVSGSFIVCSTLFYGVYGYLRLEKIQDDVHAPLGILFTILSIFIPLSGFVAY